jgi:drug/metabolite transporter (DMT)-like permease
MRVRMVGLGLGLFFLGPEVLVFYQSFDHIDTGLAVAIGFVYPTFVLLIASARTGRKPAAGDVALCLPATAGIVLLTVPGADHNVSLTGVLLVLTSAILYASYAVIASELSGRIGPSLLGVHVMCGVGVTAVVASLLRGDLALPDTTDEWLLVATQAMLLVIAISCYFGGLRHLGPTRASFVDMGQPPVAVAMGAMLLGERILPLQGLGVALVMSSIAAFTWLDRRRAVVPYVDPP